MSSIAGNEKFAIGYDNSSSTSSQFTRSSHYFQRFWLDDKPRANPNSVVKPSLNLSTPELESALRAFYMGKRCVFSTATRPKPYEVARKDDDTWHHLDEPKSKSEKVDSVVNVIPLCSDFNLALGTLRKKKGQATPACMDPAHIRSVCKHHLEVGNRRLAYGCWRFGAFAHFNSSSLRPEEKRDKTLLRSFLPFSLESATNALEVLILEKDPQFATDTLERSILPILAYEDLGLTLPPSKWLVAEETIAKIATDISDHYKLCTNYLSADRWIRLADALVLKTEQPDEGVLARRLAYHYAENRLSHAAYDYAHSGTSRRYSDEEILLRLNEGEAWLDAAIQGLSQRPNLIGRLPLAIAKAAAAIFRFYVTSNTRHLTKAEEIMSVARQLVDAGRLATRLGSNFVDEITSTAPYFALISSEISICRNGGKATEKDFMLAREAYRELAGQPVCAKNTATLLNIIKVVEDSKQVTPITWRVERDLHSFTESAEKVRKLLEGICPNVVSRLPTLSVVSREKAKAGEAGMFASISVLAEGIL